MKKGLVLEGGAMRGLFTAGVMDVMMENNIEFDGAIGVSAGAAFGCNYKSKQIGRVIRYNTTYAKDWRMCSLRSLILTGDLYGAEFCYRTLPMELDKMDGETYKNNPMEFYAVATDADTGLPDYRRIDEVTEETLDYIRASASMPFVSKPVEVYGHRYLDGGISDSIPLRAFENLGYTRNVVVLTRPASYRKTRMPMQKLMKTALRKYPEIIRDLEIRHVSYNETLDEIAQKERDGKVFVIRPLQALQIGKTEHDTEIMKTVYYQGRMTCEKHLEAMKKFLDAPAEDEKPESITGDQI